MMRLRDEGVTQEEETETITSKDRRNEANQRKPETYRGY